MTTRRRCVLARGRLQFVDEGLSQVAVANATFFRTVNTTARAEGGVTITCEGPKGLREVRIIASWPALPYFLSTSCAPAYCFICVDHLASSPFSSGAAASTSGNTGTAHAGVGSPRECLGCKAAPRHRDSAEEDLKLASQGARKRLIVSFLFFRFPRQFSAAGEPQIKCRSAQSAPKSAITVLDKLNPNPKLTTHCAGVVS